MRRDENKRKRYINLKCQIYIVNFPLREIYQKKLSNLKNKGKSLNKIEQSLRKLWDKFIYTNTHVIIVIE